MPYNIYFGWALIIPVFLAAAYGAASFWATKNLLSMSESAPVKSSFVYWLRNILPVLIVLVLWSAVAAPLALFYLLIFASRLLDGLGPKNVRLRSLFLMNLVHLLSISLHMLLIGVISLALDISMKALLEQPFWRILTISVVMLLNILTSILASRRGLFLQVIYTQADSREVRPFMTFLWFCNLSLLLDSILCFSSIEWNLLPLFLVSSTLLLELYLFRFLAHIYSILKVNYLEEENQRLEEELERQARRAEELRIRGDVDALTGLYSRRYIRDWTERLLRSREPFTLAYLDLDKLKQINDQEGHQAGDCYLIQFARLVEQRLRKSDIFARIGGDEFVIVLPGCRGDAARSRMEQIRLSLERENCCGHSFSFSFGVAEAPGDGETDMEQLVRRADQAMYRDKNRSAQ